MTAKTANSTLLTAKALTKRFYRPQQQTILKEIDLEVAPGTTVAISGRSGAGKSTLLQLLGTLDTPCSGTLSIANTLVTPWNRAALRNKHLGFIFQSFCLLSDYSAIDNVLMPANIARKPIAPGSVVYQNAEELLVRVGLKDRLHHSAKLLSGGEKQRVALARALCNNPSLILADEPTGNLDRDTAGEIHELLFELCTVTSNRALVVVTHDRSVIALCQRHYVLQDGFLVDNQRLSE